MPSVGFGAQLLVVQRHKNRECYPSDDCPRRFAHCMFTSSLISLHGQWYVFGMDLQLGLTHRMVCCHSPTVLFTPKRGSSLLYDLPALSPLSDPTDMRLFESCTPGRVMYIGGNRISWAASSCYLSKTTSPLK